MPGAGEKPMSVGLSQKVSPKASPRLVWPPPKPGVSIHIAESPIATYSIYFGLSEWHLASPLPWLFFRGSRREHGATFDTLVGDPEKLTVFRGLNAAARRDAERIFERMAAHLRHVAAKENANGGAPSQAKCFRSRLALAGCGDER